MDAGEFRAWATRAGMEPPDRLSPALKALWYLARGEWDTAHDCAQSRNDREGAWVHAHVHRMEGDFANANYWYRRAERSPPEVSLEDEWEAIATALLDAETHGVPLREGE